MQLKLVSCISVTHSHSNLTMILKTNKFQNKSSVKILSILKKNDISNNAQEIQTHWMSKSTIKF